MNCGLIDRNTLKRVRGGMLLLEGRGSSLHPGKGDNAEHRPQRTNLFFTVKKTLVDYGSGPIHPNRQVNGDLAPVIPL